MKTIDSTVLTLVAGIIGLALGAVATYIGMKTLKRNQLEEADHKAKSLMEEAAREIAIQRRELEVEMKDFQSRLRKEFEKKFEQETREKRDEQRKQEKRLRNRENKIESKLEHLERQSQRLLTNEREVMKQKEELDKVKEKQIKQLEKIARLNIEQARELLMERLEEDLQYEIALKIKNIEDRARETAEKKAKEIITLAIERCAMEQVVDSIVSVVNLPNEEMKGRIIGREGRNIRTLERLTGVNVIIDDTPEAVVLSGFNPVRREVSRIALEKLIADGRIHPGRIEDLVIKAQAEVDKAIKEYGEQTALDLGIRSLHPDVITKLGRLHYRTSYGQNVLQHSKEVAYLAAIMASEIGIDVETTKRAGLLHDIGKAFDHEVEGSHAEIGANFLKKLGESPVVVEAVASHHDDTRPECIEAVLIQVADGISAARSGARRETLEAYIKRLDELEKIANAFRGVDKTYAIQAGREIRVLVSSNKVDDVQAVKLSRDIAKKIESQLEYPGQIKVTVIREIRAVEYAK